MRSRWLDIGQVLYLRVYGPRRTQARQKKRGQYLAILTEQAWLLYGFWEKNFLAGYSG